MDASENVVQPDSFVEVGADDDDHATSYKSKPEQQHLDESPNEPLTKWQRRYAWFVSDVLLYIVILNLASELVRNIHIERFSISLFVAVVLKLVLDAIQYLEHHVKHICCDRLGRKFLGAFAMWLIIFSSKFLILWIDDVIFGSQVDLGYFWEILILSLVLVLASIGSRWFFFQLGRWDQKDLEIALPGSDSKTGSHIVDQNHK
jgi:hypothetical protein